MKVDLNTMYRTPGVWVLCGLSVIFFVEVDADGRCFQLNPTTFDRDGELSRDGWTGNPIIVGPLARPHQGTSTPAAEPPWLPIKTAPKDPRHRILLRWRSGLSGWVCIGAWASSDDSPHLKSPTCPREGWTPDGATCIPRNQKDCIGWMPVPAALKAQP